MKKILFLTFLIFAFNSVKGQCDTERYSQSIFEGAVEYIDVKYGESTEWDIPYNKKDVKMNIYTPLDDTLTRRPLMIWVHSGGFLNGVKEHDDMLALCDSFVKRGYVTATIGYRLGFNPLSASSAERAVYRGVQDLRAAIRYLKEKHVDYGIDTNYTFIGGSSAGAFSVLQTVYMTQDDAPSSIESGLGYPALGCLDCEGNDYMHNMDITAYAALWGAIGDSAWVKPENTTPGLLVHGTTDGTVPFGVGHPFGVPTMPKTHGSRPVSNQLTAYGIPHTTYFVEGQGHEFHGTSNGTWNNPPTAYWDTIFGLINDHYRNTLYKDLEEIVVPEIVCLNDTLLFEIELPEGYTSCWESETGILIESGPTWAKFVFTEVGEHVVFAKQFSEIAAYNGEVSASVVIDSPAEIDFSYGGEGVTVTFVPEPIGFVSYLWNFGDGNSSTTLSPTHTYYEVGIYNVVLKTKSVDGCWSTVEKDIDLTSLSLSSEFVELLKVYPNPSSEFIVLTSENEMQEVRFYSSLGKEVKRIKVQDKDVKLDVSMLSEGIYFLHVLDVNKNVQQVAISIMK